MSALETRQTGSRPKDSTVSGARRSFAKLIFLVVLCFCSYLFFSRVVVTAVEVKGSSMAPTLVSGDRVLLNRFAFLHRSPERGELVVLKDPETGDLVVKRIVGMPNETVQIRDESVYIDNRKLKEPYITRSSRIVVNGSSSVTPVPKDHYFVLGDNRKNSADSRLFGPVPRENIVGVITL